MGLVNSNRIKNSSNIKYNTENLKQTSTSHVKNHQ